MILMYGTAPHPESPRIPFGPEQPEPFGPVHPFPSTPSPFQQQPAQPRGEAVDAHLFTDETLIEVEQHCIAMQRYWALPADQRAAVDRYIESARKLTGRVQTDADTYKLAQHMAEGLRSHQTREKGKP